MDHATRNLEPVGSETYPFTDSRDVQFCTLLPAGALKVLDMGFSTEGGGAVPSTQATRSWA
jgi:hypothetical protein